MPSTACPRHDTNAFSEIPSSRHISNPVLHLLITPITVLRFRTAVNVNFHPICRPASQVRQPAGLRKGLSTHIKGKAPRISRLKPYEYWWSTSWIAIGLSERND
ncbi:MAG: hypothetical protein JW395_0970 [Nitrospira sp.]|nr:hypothetical protein [Nitrospira sp.]